MNEARDDGRDRSVVQRARRRRGQGMVEYILIVGLIALAVFIAVRTLGQNVKDGFEKASEKVTEATNW